MSVQGTGYLYCAWRRWEALVVVDEKVDYGRKAITVTVE